MEFGFVLLWLLAVLWLGAVTLPLAAALLPGVDSGPLTFAIALAVLAVVGHLVGHIAFPVPAVLAGLTVLVVATLAASRRVEPELESFADAAVVFTLGFLLIVAIRAVDPAAGPLPVAVGEKLLDYGLLATLDRSSTLPPEDMWYAGRSVRYYYGGHMTTVLLATLTRTPIRLAYNLGLATFYATLVTAAYGLAGSIAAGHGHSRRTAGGLAAFFVGLAGNLTTSARLVGWLLPAGVTGWFLDRAGLDPGLAEWSPRDFWYFEASRVIPVDPRQTDPFMAATEFPLFAWLNGDLHAHMMSQPFVLLVAAVLLAYWRLPAERRWRRRAVVFGTLPPIAGLLGFVNIWSFPVAGGLTVLALGFAPADPVTLLPEGVATHVPREVGGILAEVRRFGMAAAAGVLVLALGIVWTLPYWLEALPRSRGVELWAPWTPVGGLLLLNGAFLLAFAVYLVRRSVPTTARSKLAGGTVVVGALLALLLGFPAVGLFVPPLVVAWWLLRTRTDVGFETVLIVAGLGLVLIVEIATVRGERFNSIFKPYVAVWLFWSVAVGVVLTRLAEGAAARAPSLAGRIDTDQGRWRRTGTVLAVALVVVTGTYAGLALPAHFADRSDTVEARGPTLDATAYVAVEFPGEAPAIEWLNAREGQPTIVTAAPGGYWWRPAEGKGSSAPASLTGLPTVLGWFHERQYRSASAYQTRLGHVETLYEGTPEDREPLLERYDVQYVYVGPAERARYDLTVASDTALVPANRAGDVVIYRVDLSRPQRQAVDTRSSRWRGVTAQRSGGPGG